MVAFLVLALAIILLAGFVAVTPLYTSTRYAAKYSEKRFQQIKPGAPEREVRSALGNPMVEFTNHSGVVTLIYSFPDHRYFVFYYRSRSILLSNGVVHSKSSFVNSM